MKSETIKRAADRILEKTTISSLDDLNRLIGELYDIDISISDKEINDYVFFLIRYGRFSRDVFTEYLAITQCDIYVNWPFGKIEDEDD